jgi:hypothetical protein
LNSSVIKNIGTIILSSIAIIIALIVLLLLIKYSTNPTISKITESLKQKMFFNSILRTCIQSYLKFSILAFASIERPINNATLTTGLVMINFCIFFLIFAHSFLRIKRASLEDTAF